MIRGTESDYNPSLRTEKQRLYEGVETKYHGSAKMSIDHAEQT